MGPVEQCINLELLIGKYTRAKMGTLYLCFADRSSAFDLVDHNLLWVLLISLGAPRPTMGFLSRLYEKLSSQVCFGPQGECMPEFKVGRGIRQGCVLAPLLFIDGVDSHLKSLQTDAPKAAGYPIPVLLYADDAVLLARRPVGLQKLMYAFG